MSVTEFSLLFLTFASLWLLFKSRSTKQHFPPGPPADPLIGHARIIPKQNQHEIFHQRSKFYGDIMQLRALGRSIIIIGSSSVATELLDKRSAKYSGRPKLPIPEIMGITNALTFLPYGKQHRTHRTLFHEYLNPRSCKSYRSFQASEARGLLRRLSKNPDNFEDHLQTFSTGVMIRLTTGHEIKTDDDIYMKIAKDVTYALFNCGPPGGTALDMFPFLKSFPSWFPGTHYATKAREFKRYIRKLYEYPFETTRKQVAEGHAVPSFLSQHINNLMSGSGELQVTEDDIKGAAANMYAAGSSATTGTLLVFILAMTLYPEAQRKAQREIDEVVGQGRLPGFEDRESLKYTECVMQEVMRWHPIAPLGIPHQTTEDDIYNDMFIPKNSIVLANLWGICRDERIYSEPEIFNPDRFLPKPSGNGEPFPSFSYGFGRRTCAGQHLADASLWIAIVSMLAAFSITKAVNEAGIEITPEEKFRTGLTCFPATFRCNIKARNKSMEMLIEETKNLD